MSIKKKYENASMQPGFVHDPKQILAVKELQCLFDQIVASNDNNRRQNTLFSRLRWPSSQPAIYGRYIWGGVGRGKTWLMDMFHDALPINAKQRFHFHRFMSLIHSELAKSKAQRDPLKKLAAKFSQTCRVVCVDEFHVADITDAMLLYGILEALFEQQVILVATSNQQPDDLYKHGLQRNRFLPAIDLLKTHTKVIYLDGNHDHRLIHGNEIHPDHNLQRYQDLEKRFKILSNKQYLVDQSITVNNRSIRTHMLSKRMVFFDFAEICGTPRAAIDYIEIAHRFDTVCIANVPVLCDEQADKARRFVNLVDELYDQHVHTIIGTEVEPGQLYIGKRLQFEFARTASRLIEMRRHDHKSR